MDKILYYGGVGLAGAGAIALTGGLAAGAIGFTSAGIAGGSVAASVQTATTVLGSGFAIAQSLGATGTFASTAYVGGGAIVTGGVSTVLGHMLGK